MLCVVVCPCVAFLHELAPCALRFGWRVRSPADLPRLGLPRVLLVATALRVRKFATMAVAPGKKADESKDNMDTSDDAKSENASEDRLDVALEDGGTRVDDLGALMKSVHALTKFIITDYTKEGNDYEDGKRGIYVNRMLKEGLQKPLMYDAVEECMPKEKSELYNDMRKVVEDIVMTYIGKVIGFMSSTQQTKKLEDDMPGFQYISPHVRTVFLGISKALFPDAETFELFSATTALDHTDNEVLATVLSDVADLTKEARAALAKSDDMDVDPSAKKEKVKQVIQAVSDAQYNDTATGKVFNVLKSKELETKVDEALESAKASNDVAVSPRTCSTA